MLGSSILGKVYNCWLDSGCFALLRRLYRAIYAAVCESRILSALLGEGRPEKAYRESAVAALIRRLVGIVLAVLRRFSFFVSAAEESRILDFLRQSVLRVILSFEGLFGAFLFIMFVTPHSYWNNLWAVIGAFVFLGLYALLVASGRRERPDAGILGVGAVFFVLALFLSLGFSAAPRDSLRILLFFLASLAFCYTVAADFAEPEKLRALLGFLYAALMVVSVIGIAQNVLGLVEVSASYTNLELNEGVPGRVYSTLNNPNNLSEFVLMFMPLGAAYAAGAKKAWQRVLLCAALVLPALALLMTYSRAGWLAIVLAAAVFTYCCNKRLIPALILLGILCIPLLPDSVLIRLSTIGNSADTSTNHRFDIWKGVLALLGDHDRFITGIGLGPKTFSIIYPFYSVGAAKIGAYHSQMHYIELVLEMGLLGFVSFMFMMLRYTGRTVRGIVSRCETRLVLIACLSSLAALAFAGLVEYVWFYQRMMFAFFIFLGILLAAAGGKNVEKPA